MCAFKKVSFYSKKWILEKVWGPKAVPINQQTLRFNLIQCAHTAFKGTVNVYSSEPPFKEVMSEKFLSAGDVSVFLFHTEITIENIKFTLFYGYLKHPWSEKDVYGLLPTCHFIVGNSSIFKFQHYIWTNNINGIQLDDVRIKVSDCIQRFDTAFSESGSLFRYLFIYLSI